jgi:hypothetical protein
MGTLSKRYTNMTVQALATILRPLPPPGPVCRWSPMASAIRSRWHGLRHGQWFGACDFEMELINRAAARSQATISRRPSRPFHLAQINGVWCSVGWERECRALTSCLPAAVAVRCGVDALIGLGRVVWSREKSRRLPQNARASLIRGRLFCRCQCSATRLFPAIRLRPGRLTTSSPLLPRGGTSNTSRCSVVAIGLLTVAVWATCMPTAWCSYSPSGEVTQSWNVCPSH